MIIIIFFIGYHGLLQGKDVFSIYSREKNELEEDPAVILSSVPADGKGTGNTEPQRYKKSALKSEMRASIIDNLKQLMKEDELFSDTKLSIDDVARRLGVNSKYLSQSINEEFNCNFYNYVNELRVERAKVFLVAGPHDHFSIEGISSQVGFQSKSSFIVLLSVLQA
jgi:AraC-like DNA-binding protein